ncbi:Flp family type IVb pilin [Croceibacterium mercuriale]|uniref:Flp family type IVb pilin n=1 Tax=Croceibacterium mercuriale TaxID=1572751 RepID=UPI00190F503B|nr:Flp family type IVb pilin [Croceibacterium mercuriale]
MTRPYRARQWLRRLHADRSGATAIEYAMIVALIALAIFSSVSFVGEQNTASFERTAGAVEDAAGPG